MFSFRDQRGAVYWWHLSDIVRPFRSRAAGHAVLSSRWMGTRRTRALRRAASSARGGGAETA